MDRELWSILKPYDNWQNDVEPEINLRAKAALHKFYKELLNRKQDVNYQSGDISHYEYLHFFVKIQKAFKEEKYFRVCNEFGSLMHYTPFFQKRIYTNAINILEFFLRIQ